RVLHDSDARYPEHAGQLLRGHFQRPGSRALARDRLRIGRGTRGMEGHVALDLLHDLVDVTIQHSDRAEAAQLLHELWGIRCSPTPRLVDGPQRHVRKHHDRRAGGATLEVVREPRELLGAERAEAAGLELQHVDKCYEVDTRVIEAVVALVPG